MDLLVIDVVLPRRGFSLHAELRLGAETIALVGPSGAGKTSLLRTVAGLERAARGKISLAGEAWLDSDRGLNLPAERRRVGYLPQDYGLFPHLDVAGNIRFAGREDRLDLLSLVGIAHLASAKPRQLSGGERQRAALARALAREPSVLLLDEPFGALDPVTRSQVRDQLSDLLGPLGLPTLLVTHSFEDAASIAGRVGVIDAGRLLQVAPVPELLRAPADAVVAALTGANVLHGNAAPSARGSTVALAGGGELVSEATASGPVEIAIHPWELELVEPSESSVTDRVISVRDHHGRLLVRLERFTAQLEAARNGRRAIEPGQAVGVRVAPTCVRVLGAGSRAIPEPPAC